MVTIDWKKRKKVTIGRKKVTIGRNLVTIGFLKPFIHQGFKGAEKVTQK